MENREKMEHELYALRKRGRRYFRRGVIFLAVCLIVSQLVVFFNFPFAELISESAIVAGWVGLWRPMEIFLYDVPELSDQLRSLPQQDNGEYDKPNG